METGYSDGEIFSSLEFCVSWDLDVCTDTEPDAAPACGVAVMHVQNTAPKGPLRKGGFKGETEAQRNHGNFIKRDNSNMSWPGGGRVRVCVCECM